MSETYERIQNVLIVGAGWVGRQIAAKLAIHDFNVALVDKSVDVCLDAIAWMRGLPVEETDGVSVEKWIERVRYLSGIPIDNSESFQLVLECTPEQISLKKRVLRELSGAFASPVIIASNSSYFVPSVLAGFVSDPKRFVHVHFHVPVLHDSVADIVGCSSTEQDVIATMEEMVQRMGHEPLLLRKEHPGYIYNWLLQSVLRSAMELVALDVADPEVIDKSWTTVTGMPLGPFGIMDQIGLDVIEQVLSNARWAPSNEVDTEQLLTMLRAMTSEGRLGTKTGAGFYDYKGNE